MWKNIFRSWALKIILSNVGYVYQTQQKHLRTSHHLMKCNKALAFQELVSRFCNSGVSTLLLKPCCATSSHSLQEEKRLTNKTWKNTRRMKISAEFLKAQKICQALNHFSLQAREKPLFLLHCTLLWS